jgi:hypothetical protein
MGLNSNNQQGAMTEPSRLIEYNYTDETGNLLFQVVRGRRLKGFRQRRPDANGSWIYDREGTPDVPYRYPDLLRARNKGTEGDTVFIVEGEKDVETLRSLGFTATCNAGGAGNWPKGMVKGFHGVDVVLIPDNDEAGHHHVQKVILILSGTAQRRLGFSRDFCEQNFGHDTPTSRPVALKSADRYEQPNTILTNVTLLVAL